MNIDKQIITDLYEVIRSQHRVITYLVANDHGLVSVLSNSSVLPLFVDSFQNHQSYALTHPTGPLAEALAELEHMLAEVGEKLKRDTGGWDN